jgi:hypothetical protein
MLTKWTWTIWNEEEHEFVFRDWFVSKLLVYSQIAILVGKIMMNLEYHCSGFINASSCLLHLFYSLAGTLQHVPTQHS